MKALVRLLAVFPVLALLLAIPGPAVPYEYSDIPPPLVRGGPVNDLGDVLSPESERRLAAMIRERQAAGRRIALITIPSSHAFGASLYLPTLARRVLVARGVEKGRSVVLIHDVDGRALALALGDGFTEAERAEALAYLRRQYRPKIRSGKAEAVHLESFPALLDLLPAKGAAGGMATEAMEESRDIAPKTAAKKPAKMGGKPRSRAAARETEPSLDPDAVINDLPGVLTRRAKTGILEMIAPRRKAGQDVRLVILPDIPGKHPRRSALSLAREAFGELGLAQKPRAILILHDLGRNQVVIILGSGYSRAEKEKKRRIVDTAYRRLVRRMPPAEAHLKGMRTLLDTLPARPGAGAARAGTSGRGSETPGTVLHAPPEPVDEHKPPLIPWSWVLLSGIIGYAGVTFLEWRRKRRVLALIYDSGGVSLRGGAESPSGAAWSRGLPAERRAAARSIPLSGRGPMRCGDPCPRCGGPVFREMVEPAPLYGPKHIRAGCGRCTWFTETVTRRPRLAKAESRPPMADLR